MREAATAVCSLLLLPGYEGHNYSIIQLQANGIEVSRYPYGR